MEALIPLVLLGALALASIGVYFAPMIVAACRQHPNADSIAIVNLFLGWTFIGWVICLAWAFGDIRR